jgi:hypothetical protein
MPRFLVVRDNTRERDVIHVVLRRSFFLPQSRRATLELRLGPFRIKNLAHFECQRTATGFFFLYLPMATSQVRKF